MGNRIRQYLIEKGYNTVSDETYRYIDEWMEWYQGDVEKFHKYKVFNGVATTTQKRYSLGMAKKVCEDWANLLLNEKVSIKAGNYEKRLNEVLRINNFRVKGNQLIELAFALGTGAFVEYKDAQGDIIIDFVRADMIYPLSWDNGNITECAFGCTMVINGKEVIYLQIHRKGKVAEDAETIEKTDQYYIENKYIDAESGKEVETSKNVIPIIDTGYSSPLFQIITPNICNNIDLDSPLGISIYANSMAQLKGCDLVYDSYINEYILGRKRIMVPITMAKKMMEKEGITAPSFDPNDTVYYLMPSDNRDESKPEQVDMSIRAQEHELGIQRCLDILSLKIGMGTGRYQFNSSGVKTATEVISDKSDLYQNRQKNAIIIEAALIALVRAVAFLDTGIEVETTVNFDDSIIEDTNATIDKNIKLVQEGLRSKLTAIMEIEKCSEQDAKKELERIAEDEQITGQDIDWTEGDEEELNPTIGFQPDKDGDVDGSTEEPESR